LQPLGRIASTRCKQPKRAPTVLSQSEARRVLMALDEHPTLGLLG